MYMLVATPTSADGKPETTTFTDIDTLWEHVKQIKGYVEPPTPKEEAIGLSTENRYLKGVLVDIYMRLDKEFRGLKSGEQSLEGVFLGPSPFNQGTLRAEPFAFKSEWNSSVLEIEEAPQTQEERKPKEFILKGPVVQIGKESFLEKFKDWKSPAGVPFFAAKSTPLQELSGNTVEFDPQTMRKTYMTDIFKPDILPKPDLSWDAASTHDSDSLFERMKQVRHVPPRSFHSAKVDLFRNLFIENFTKPIANRWDHDSDYNLTFFSWVLFVNFPKRFLASEGKQFPAGLSDILEYDLQGMYSTIEKKIHQHTINQELPAFRTYDLLLKAVMPQKRDEIDFQKQRSWESICCNTLLALYDIEERKETKFPIFHLDGWIQFFLDSEIVGKKGSQIQSSILFTDFVEYMKKIVRATESELLFKPLLDAITIQVFSKAMKDVYGMKTQRKAAGIFYMDIDYAKNMAGAGAGGGLTGGIEGADFADLHREAKLESNWAPI